jgi:hypothetical protein
VKHRESRSRCIKARFVLEEIGIDLRLYIRGDMYEIDGVWYRYRGWSGVAQASLVFLLGKRRFIR